MAMDVIKKISILVFVVVSLTGCDKFVALFHRDSEPETHGYYLALIFENSSGENLAESIELSNCDYDLNGQIQWGMIDSDLYTLEIFPKNYIDGEEFEGPDLYPAVYVKEMEVKRFETGLSFIIYFYRSKKDNNVRKLTYKLKCPHIFGDEETHELVSYWNLTDDKYAKCYLIEFNGQEITPKALDDQKYFLGVIKQDSELSNSEGFGKSLN